MSSEEKESNGIDKLEDLVGEFGPWQRNMFLIAFLNLMPISWQILVPTFFAPEIDHWCSPPPAYSNLTSSQWKSLAIPQITNENDTVIYSSCLMYKTITYSLSESEYSNVTCTSWEYDNSFYTSTIVDEWNLVCDKAWLQSASTTISMAGVLVAVFISGQLADRFGRRPVILLGVFILLVAGIGCAFSSTFIVFNILRFLSTFGATFLTFSSYVLMLESVSVKYRNILPLCSEFGWSLGFSILPAIAWFIRDWSNLQLAITIPWVVLVTYWWFLPESVRWLLTQDKKKQAEKELEKALILNKKQVSNLEDVVKQLANKINKEEKTTVMDLLLTPNMRRNTLNLYFIWFILALVYYGFSLNSTNLGGNPFLNFFISGAVEFPSYGASVFAVKYLGRRISGMSTMVIAGLACILTIPIPDEQLSLRITVSMIGKAFISAAFGIMIFFSSEIFPTVVRNVGVGSSSMFARIGSMVAPFAVKELSKVTNPKVPLGVFGGFSIFAGLLILLLPETSGKPIPDTLEEGEEFGKKHSAKVSPLGKEIVFSTKL
ncbi:organic cation transporter protein-like [Tachypleus tridentatus]|uniref:organic cation transporter protein-like n=1 Tax=Tachypleus tridentatus TaxID=6853 RepID=UPI003FCFCC64